ncbi:LysM peptidoglycan-binding domain-containing protein [Leucobacter albus]|uniref:LysM peptidoglycan-binding domain-containing protein n=1 Tax=Leucobacter albus TaxID=272210 RepID=A0ABW3TIP1_9MICO
MTATAIVTPLSPRIGAAASTVAGPAKLRLTRRGRIVFGGLATVLIAGALGVAAAFAAPGAEANGTVSSQEFPYVLAQSGDSLWSIASALDPAADPRDIVAELQRLNQIDAADLRAGDSIAVPLRFEGSDLTFAAIGE